MLPFAPQSNQRTIDLANEMHQMSVDRLERIHPVWQQFILAVNDLPAPRRFDILSEEERSLLHEWLLTTQGEQDTLSSQDRLLEHKLYINSYNQLQKGNFGQALRYTRCLLEYAPEESCYRLLQGLAEFGAGNYQRALQYLDLALYYTPEHPLSNAVTGLIAAFSRDHVKALRCARTALAQRSHIDNWRGAPWLELALFQSEHLLFGHSSSGGLNSGLFVETSIRAHLEQLAAVLPPTYEYLDFSDGERKDVLFVSCDDTYFVKYAVPLALSLVECDSPLALHIHLVNPGDEDFALLQRLDTLLAGNLRATYERTVIDSICHPSVYYSCMRFCRMAQFKLSSVHDYAMLDADMLVNRSFSFAELRAIASNDADCILTYSPNEPIWDCLLAGFCLFGARADNLLANISAFILRSIQQQKSRWFLDQVALFLAAQHSTDGQIGYAAAKAFYDLEHNPDSYIWAVTTEKHAKNFTAKAAYLLDRYLTAAQ